MDMRLQVPPIAFGELAAHPSGESSLAIRARVCEARECQRRRQGRARPDTDRGYPNGQGPPSPPWNASLTPAGISRWCRVGSEGNRLLEDAADRLALSARGVHRVLRIARTIADLEGAARIAEEHLAEAIQYRG
jgi:magnesium chelatase family protein